MIVSEMTLNKYIADSGVCSRRKAAELIKDGEILVNAVTITDPGYRVQPHDSVKYNGKLLKSSKKMYILLNKPKGYISSVDDPFNHKTVMDLLKPTIKERVYPVGRLDVETSGLLMLTNDGALAQKLAHPRYEVRKLYAVTLDRQLLEDDMQTLRNGITLPDGKVKPDNIYYLTKKSRSIIGVELHSGKNRIVRRMFGKLGYHIDNLDRIGLAHLNKFGLDSGSWRFLTHEEILTLSKKAS